MTEATQELFERWTAIPALPWRSGWPLHAPADSRNEPRAGDEPPLLTAAGERRFVLPETGEAASFGLGPSARRYRYVRYLADTVILTRSRESVRRPVFIRHAAPGVVRISAPSGIDLDPLPADSWATGCQDGGRGTEWVLARDPQSDTDALLARFGARPEMAPGRSVLSALLDQDDEEAAWTAIAS